MLILLSAMAGLASYVTQSVRLSSRRTDMITAFQYAQSGACLAGADLQNAVTNSGGSDFFATLQSNPAGAYTFMSELSGSQQKIYQRTITTPFTNQTVTAQIWMTNQPSPPSARIVSVATVGSVTQTSILHVDMKFGYGAAIISDNKGTTTTSTSKSTTAGNVCINGDKTGPIVVDGGDGLAILANGRANIDTTYAHIPASAISMTNYGTSHQIPDYTAEGSADQLFDFDRFIAVANATVGPSSAGNNHFTNLLSFINANNAAAAVAGGALEGVVVVNVVDKDPGISKLTPTGIPKGINVRGTLVLNFDASYLPTDKIINTSTMNINPADLSGLVATNPATYTSGYPPVYANAAKNPINVDISPAFPNFTAADDLPALMYNIGILDIHGNANISGVVYTPSFMEIENKQDGQIQYFKGSMIGGTGIYFENTKASTSIISYDPSALDCLATEANKGKRVLATYWE